MSQRDETLDELLKAAGLDGLDALGRRKFRQAVAASRRARPFTGKLAAQLNGLDEVAVVEFLAGLDDLDGIGKKLRKVAKKAGNVVAKVAKVIPAAALVVPTKDALKNAAKGLAIGGAGAGLMALLPAGAAAGVAETAAGAALPALLPSASPAESYVSSAGGSGGGYGGASAPIEGEYIAAGEPDPVADSGQWIRGVSNTAVLLTGAGALSVLLFVLVTRRRRMEYSRNAA